jgi:hypothetical protein
LSLNTTCSHQLDYIDPPWNSLYFSWTSERIPRATGGRGIGKSSDGGPGTVSQSRKGLATLRDVHQHGGNITPRCSLDFKMSLHVAVTELLTPEKCPFGENVPKSEAFPAQTTQRKWARKHGLQTRRWRCLMCFKRCSVSL